MERCPLCHAHLQISQNGSARAPDAKNLFTAGPAAQIPPAAGCAEGVRRGGCFPPAWAWPYLEKKRVEFIPLV